jgi:hypothetical protein
MQTHYVDLRDPDTGKLTSVYMGGKIHIAAQAVPNKPGERVQNDPSQTGSNQNIVASSGRYFRLLLTILFRS